MAVQGDGPRNHPAIRHLKLPPLGIYHRTYCLVTKTLLITMQEGSWFGQDPPDEPARMRAFDKKTGKLIAQIAMPTHATGAPITYEVGGKQYIVVPVGGQNLPAELLAFSLP
jgi:quinoprotein glucose dehydrogenase